MPGIQCPHCTSKSIVRTSVQVTDLVRDLHMACDNIDCGHTFVAQLSIIRTIRPAAKPNPAVRLPFGEWRGAPAKPANDDSPPLEAPCSPANDDGDIAATIGATLAPPMT
ncbi:ogr/Delta-like zinc finger family protein [Sphingomonas melonis]|uniref:ogr/Delta-like zinc finger family protein n=1 Tax=Sphingomonas melonis TaxID=152682 RepID=UPI00037853D9|nr:ogr/Delta-like zinc finger family protein [Sphingomonas melonis]